MEVQPYVKGGGSRTRPQRGPGPLWPLALIALLLAGCQDEPRQTPGTTQQTFVSTGGDLAPGSRIEIPAAERSLHTFSLDADAGSYHRFRTEARGNDLKLSIVDPAGEILRSTEGNGRTWGTELFGFEATTAGVHELHIEVVDRRAGATISLEAEPTRFVGEHVTVRNDAEKLIGEARRIRKTTAENNEQAGEKAAKAAELYASIGDDYGEAVAALENSSLCLDGDRRDCVLERARRALELADELDDTGLLAQALPLAAAGELLVRDGDDEEGRDLAQRAIELARGSKPDRHLARAHLFYAFYQWKRTPIERLPTLERTEELFLEVGDLLGASETASSVGQYYRDQGDPIQATICYERAARLLERHGDDPRARFWLLNNLGVLYRQRGELVRARDTYREAREIFDSTGFGSKAIIYSNLGRVQTALGKFDEALELHEQVLEIQPGMGHLDIGWIRTFQDRHGDARASFEAALKHLDESHARYGSALTGLGRALLRLGRYDEASIELEKALERFERARNVAAKGITLGIMAELQWQTGSPEQAATLLREVRAEFKRIGDDNREALIDSLLGRVEQSRGRLEDARTHFEAAIEVAESLRSSIDNIDHRADFFATIQDTYLSYIEVLADLAAREPGAGHDIAAFEASEQSRARSLVDVLRQAQWESSIDFDSPLIEEEAKLNQSLSSARDQIERLVAEENPDREQMVAVRREIEQLTLQREELWAEIEAELPRYAELRSPRAATIEQIQSALADDTALLHYTLGDAESFLFVLTAAKLEMYRLPTPRADLSDLTRELGSVVRRQRRERFDHYAHQLYERLLAPAQEILRTKRRWIIVPDGALYFVPFEALLSRSEGRAAEYMIERAAISYVQSATILATANPVDGQVPEARRFASLADPDLSDVEAARHLRPLPGARNEIDQIASLIRASGGKAVTLRGGEATEEAVKREEEFRKARWLHFATHGQLDVVDPASSGLLLAGGDSGEDGRLTSQEIFSLRFDADLICLSACDSGLGRELRGEGIVGLTRAFMYAGAASVLVSLWQVEDRSTSELMVAFYRHLLAGASKSEAIRNAKLELLHDEETSNPFFWAPFVLVGQP